MAKTYLGITDPCIARKGHRRINIEEWIKGSKKSKNVNRTIFMNTDQWSLIWHRLHLRAFFAFEGQSCYSVFDCYAFLQSPLFSLIQPVSTGLIEGLKYWTKSADCIRQTGAVTTICTSNSAVERKFGLNVIWLRARFDLGMPVLAEQKLKNTHCAELSCFTSTESCCEELKKCVIFSWAKNFKVSNPSILTSTNLVIIET